MQMQSSLRNPLMVGGPLKISVILLLQTQCYSLSIAQKQTFRILGLIELYYKIPVLNLNNLQSICVIFSSCLSVTRSRSDTCDKCRFLRKHAFIKKDSRLSNYSKAGLHISTYFYCGFYDEKSYSIQAYSIYARRIHQERNWSAGPERKDTLNLGIQKTFRNSGIKTGMPSRDFLLRPSFFQPNPKQFKQSRLSTSKCTDMLIRLQ